MALNTPLSRLLRIIIAFLSIASAAAYGALGGNHPYLNLRSLGLILLFGGILYASSGRLARMHPPVMIVTLPLILFVQLRLLVLIVIPSSLLHYSHVTSEMINVTLTYIIAGTFACYWGVALGYGRVKASLFPSDATVGRSDVRFTILSAAFFAAFVFTYLDYFIQGYAGATGSGAHLGFFQRYVTRLIDPHVLFVLVVTAYLARLHKSRHHGLFIAILILYAVGFVLRGSRSGFFEIVTILVGAKIIADNDFVMRINLTKAALAMAVVAVSIVGYILASDLRGRWYDHDFRANLSSETFLRGNGAISSGTDLLSEISYRLSFIEPTLFPAYAEELELNDVSHLVNTRTTMLSSINRLVPGKPFGDILFSEYAFGYIYNPVDGIVAVSADGRVDHVGYEWSMFGISYQLFGFCGGVVFIFGLSALLARIMRHFRGRGGFSSLAYSVFFSIVLAAWIRTLGLDNLIDGTMHDLILLCLYVMGFRCFRKFAAARNLGSRTSGWQSVS